MRWLFPLALSLFAPPLFAAPPDFDKQVAPLIARRCLDCHAGAEAKGKLDLSRRAGAAEVIAGKAESELWKRVAADEMPPKKPLTADEKATLKAWLDAGAIWGRDPIDPLAATTDHRAGRDWWALQPVVKSQESGVRKSVDDFIRAKLRERGLAPSPPADPRTQIRRLYFDLIGLPPSPEEVEAFAKNPTDAAYAKVVDHLLASPHYGERWGRHWLDLVRYGESDSFERNEPRPNAWHYRDWVIDALNADVPYDRFAKLQLAGDALETGNPNAVKAAGFLVAGIHNTVLGADDVAKRTARQDELEDMLAAVGQTFLGLTVQCARCHDHKFDPVTQADYYRLTAAIGGVYHGERTLTSPENQRRKQELEAKLGAAEKSLAALEAAGRQRAAKRAVATLPVSPIGRWTFEKDATDSIGSLHGTLKDGATVASGRLKLDGRKAHVVTAALTKDLREKTLEAWVVLPMLDQGGGGVITVETANGGVFDSIVFAENQPRKWMAGSNSFTRTRPVAGELEKETAAPIHVVVVYHADGRIALFRNGQPYGEPYRPGEAVTLKAGDARVVFGMRHTGGGKPFLTGEIEEARLYDTALTPADVAASAKAGPGAVGVRVEEMLAALTVAEKAERETLLAERTKLREQLAAIPPPLPVFTVLSKPVPRTHVLARGSVEKPLAEVTAGGVAAVSGVADFGLPADADEGQRRAKLAAWVARAENPLFARVIVNRLWHHHFGVGLVETPSDFGFNGGRPSHPELLDRLAGELIEHGWSLKYVHKLMVTSAAYRQSSAKNPAAVAMDADNRLLWRKSPTRLEAEAIRDAILQVSGQLNPAVGGPPFHDVRTHGNAGTKFYEPIDPEGAAFHRRTVYRFSPRGERSALLETFDCPDPSALTPRRQVTTTPLQALALWNDSFVLRMSGHFEKRIEAERAKADDIAVSAKVERAYRLALGRSPTDGELKPAVAFVEKHGLKSLGRVLFNCDEFVVIE
ncbi:DUF1553 domain-containing protein [Limnoglobus roseus]|uniref:LamG-like jellyroll fold domain-containing protein n=1 Tax=Limnoglobus roseus TaxID=2598579 RepID=A0A5C1AAZ3_9BACT|nr:DUF1553 domain-containing protein [Limnoglobus roseus]QEL15387.1 hypothetical protein PX52LOC_02302 [Limnoglobus roseus]